MRNGKYYVRIASNGKPVMGSLMERKAAPKDGGRWADVTSCLGLCCGFYDPEFPSPGNFTLSDGETTEIDAAWNAVAGAVTYKLERATDATFTTGLTTVQNTSATSVTDTGLTSGVHYYYRLSVIGAGGAAGSFGYADRVAP